MFELANPWALLVIVVPLLVWLIFPRSAVSLPSALKVPFFKAMEGIVEQEKRAVSGQKSLVIPALIWLLLVIALAGPRWIGEPRPVMREGYNIMMVLDLSGSMEISDMLLNGQPASRLAVVKRAAEQFVLARAGDRIGLILFGTRAYLQTPLTYDRNNVLLRLEDASAGLAGKTTSIGDALGLAVKNLDTVSKKGRVIILLTDGANNTGVLSPLKAAELAKDEGIKIYTIGLGSEGDPTSMSGGFMPLNVSADLDEGTLTKIADMTGGQYFRATDTQTLHSIYKTIHKLERVSQEQATVRPQKEYYSWFGGFALLLCGYWLTRKARVILRIKSALTSSKEFAE